MHDSPTPLRLRWLGSPRRVHVETRKSILLYGGMSGLTTRDQSTSEAVDAMANGVEDGGRLCVCALCGPFRIAEVNPDAVTGFWRWES